MNTFLFFVKYFQEGNWVWEASGEPFSFTNWDSDSPDNDRSTNCVRLTDGSFTWWDIDCARTDNYRPFCQILN